MWMCEKCKAVFDEPDTLYNGGGDWGEHWFVCPECGYESIAECGICVSCGAPVPDESGECVCENCLSQRLTPADALEYGDVRREPVLINGYITRVFSAEEISAKLLEYYLETAGGEIGGILENMRRVRLAEQYLQEDPGDYKEFISRRK